MARNRMIKKEFWEDPTVGAWKRDTRLFFIAMWNLCDDKGYCVKDERWLKVKIFPYDDDISTEYIKELLQQVCDSGITLIQNGIIRVKNFNKHQTINRPQPSELEERFRGHNDKPGGDNRDGEDEAESNNDNDCVIKSISLRTHTPFTEPSVSKEKENLNQKKEKGEKKEKEKENKKEKGEGVPPPVSLSPLKYLKPVKGVPIEKSWQEFSSKMTNKRPVEVAA